MRKTLLLLLLPLLASCGAKDPNYNTAHPDHGTVTLTADWSRRGTGIDIPASYTVQAGDYTATLGDATHRIDHLFEPGTYRFYIYSTPEQVSISGTTDRIETVEGYLSGAAATLDMDNGTYGTPSNVALTFTKITSGADAGKWSATVRLLGVAGVAQQLTAQIRFSGNSPQPVTLTSDLTTMLATFNTDKTKPLALGGTVAETPTGAGFTATITDWTPIHGGPVTAD